MSLNRFNLKTYLSFPLRWIDSIYTSSEEQIPSWGGMPLIAVFASIGVLVLSAGYSRARNGLNGGMTLFWIGIIIVYLPVAIRFVMKNVGRYEAVGIVIIVALSTFLMNYLRNPLYFLGFDEFLHWRTAFDILQTQHLFSLNSLLPVSPLYPGLENVTTALVSLSGLSIINAGFVVLAIARIIMLLSLYLVFEEITKITQIAGIAILIYTGSSTFLFFDGAYGYESLAIPLAALSLFMLLRRTSSRGGAYWAWTILISTILFAVVPTHHVTSFLLAAFLVLWTCIDLYVQWFGWEGVDPFGLATWLTFSSLLWIGTIGQTALGYLSSIAGGAYDSLVSLLTGQNAPRQLFVNGAGQGAVVFEKVFSLLSVLILGIGLLIGVWQWWLKYRRNSIAISFALVALVYPALPVMRLSSGAWEVSNRLSGFVYVALAFIVAIGMLEFPLPTRLLRIRQWLVVFCVVMVFVGGVASGSSPQTRLPSPYLPAAESRSIDHEGIATAEWARQTLGSNNHMAADRILTVLMGAYGTQRMIVDLSDHVSISGLFLHFNVTTSDRDLIKQMQIRYLVIDRRISTTLPILGYYFEKWEQLIVEYVPPINLSALDKYDNTKDVSRIYDSGDLVIYDVEALGNAP